MTAVGQVDERMYIEICFSDRALQRLRPLVPADNLAPRETGAPKRSSHRSTWFMHSGKFAAQDDDDLKSGARLAR